MKRNQVIFGVLLLGLGLLLLLGVVLEINIWSLMCPLFLIVAGVWLLLRPRLEDLPFNLKLVGDIRRRGDWQVEPEDIWLFVGDVVLDMSEAVLPDGETDLKVQGFVGSVKLRIPQGIGVAVNSTAFVSDVRLEGQKQNAFIMPVIIKSPEYDTLVKKINLETLYFVGDIKIDRV